MRFDNHPVCSNGKIDLFERNSSFSRMTLCNYWKVIPQFVPLNDLCADNCILQIGTVQAARVHLHFCSMEVYIGKN